VKSRGCPAAVSENELHPEEPAGSEHWSFGIREAVDSRNPAQPEELVSPKACPHPAPGDIRFRSEPVASREASWVDARRGLAPIG
jgi:hypothetical protein